MKIVTHLLLLAIGAAFGVWWGVNHPTQAANLAAREQRAAAQAKIDVLEKLHAYTGPGAAPVQGAASAAGTNPPATDKVQEMLDQSHKDLDAANQQLQGQ